MSDLNFAREIVKDRQQAAGQKLAAAAQAAAAEDRLHEAGPSIFDVYKEVLRGTGVSADELINTAERIVRETIDELGHINEWHEHPEFALADAPEGMSTVDAIEANVLRAIAINMGCIVAIDRLVAH